MTLEFIVDFYFYNFVVWHTIIVRFYFSSPFQADN